MFAITAPYTTTSIHCAYGWLSQHLRLPVIRLHYYYQTQHVLQWSIRHFHSEHCVVSAMPANHWMSFYHIKSKSNSHNRHLREKICIGKSWNTTIVLNMTFSVIATSSSGTLRWWLLRNSILFAFSMFRFLFSSIFFLSIFAPFLFLPATITFSLSPSPFPSPSPPLALPLSVLSTLICCRILSHFGLFIRFLRILISLHFISINFPTFSSASLSIPPFSFT